MMTAITPSAKRTRTQWAAQFLAASELVRRGYTVAFTMGNHTPVADMMVSTPGRDKQFWVDVKGLSSRNAWLMKENQPHADLYYMLVCLARLTPDGEARKPDQFFILSQEDINSLLRRSREAHPTDPTSGFAFSYAEPFAENWKILPQGISN